jgi:hypothetical protein
MTLFRALRVGVDHGAIPAMHQRLIQRKKPLFSFVARRTLR